MENNLRVGLQGFAKVGFEGVTETWNVVQHEVNKYWKGKLKESFSLAAVEWLGTGTGSRLSQRLRVTPPGHRHQCLAHGQSRTPAVGQMWLDAAKMLLRWRQRRWYFDNRSGPFLKDFMWKAFKIIHINGCYEVLLTHIKSLKVPFFCSLFGLSLIEVKI